MPTFKALVVREQLREEKTLAQVAAEHGVHPSQLIKWRATAVQELPSLFVRQHSAVVLKADYEARLATEVAWLKRKSGLAPAAC